MTKKKSKRKRKRNHKITMTMAPKKKIKNMRRVKKTNLQAMLILKAMLKQKSKKMLKKMKHRSITRWKT